MIAGRLNERIVVYAPKVVTDSYGSPTECEYEQRGEIHAERVKHTGTELNEAGEIFADYRSEWRIRICHEVREGWRVRDCYGILYAVRTVIPNVHKDMITLSCERVNE